MQNIKNTIISATTIVEPTGVPARIEMIIPKKVQTTERIAEHIVTDLKLLKTLIAESAGKMISADIRSEPTRFIARTIITAIMTAIRKLYPRALLPAATAKFSSNVTAKILL